MLLSSLPKNWQIRKWGNSKEPQRQLSRLCSSTSTPRSWPQAAKLRRPPSPLYLFIHHAKYRKWASSRILLRFSMILPSRFKTRMRRRVLKHRGAASRLAQKRDAVIAQLTLPAREIFLELEALYVNSPESKRNR